MQRGFGEDAEVETVARSGVPGVTTAATADGLLVGDVEGALGRAVGGGIEQQRVRGFGRREVMQACGKAGADECGTECGGI